MISKWCLTASADEVISHRDLGIIRLDALSLQSVLDALIPLQGRKEKCELFLFENTMQAKLTLKLQTHIIAKFSVDFLFLH